MFANLKEFKPALLFLAKFLGIYLAGNLAYGLFVESYNPLPDPVTEYVSANTCTILNSAGYNTAAAPHATLPTVVISNFGQEVISVFEGCNSINVIIVFVAFMIAFGRFSIRKLWFIIAGIIVIYLLNLARVTFLFWVAESIPDYLYFAHKYVFTIFIYSIVLILWYLWLFKLDENPAKST